MHRSSQSVAALAAALAKAQIEFVNPEKSLTASIRGERRGEADRTFRYAPLATGLDIVRKTLGKHELAVVQTTAVDQPAGTVNLTTVLAHSSGEWISSDWPVCQLADIAVPHRMGAALTYARRYALFALVGIAGEDDLDAPDLDIESRRSEGSVDKTEIAAVDTAQPNASFSRPAGSLATRHKGLGKDNRPTILGADKSATLREQLIAQIAGLSSSDEATQWVRGALCLKNQLAAADADLVEQTFASQIATLREKDPKDVATTADGADGVVTVDHGNAEPLQSVARQKPNGLGEAHSRLGAPPRRRDKVHLKYVAAQPCLVCGRQPSDPHHLRFAQATALGRKVSDEFTVPLCRSHHRELHRSSAEHQWWERLAIDPLPIATRLWNETHGLSHPVAGDGQLVTRSRIDRKRRVNGNVGGSRKRQSETSVPAKSHDLAKTD